METFTVFCPAKVNLTLAVTGRGNDGYHNLVSLAAPLKFGDVLRLRRTASPGVSLEVSGEAAPGGEDNLVLKAARRFLEHVPAEGGFAFGLEKKIPAGAGLGGGSSDAAAALNALNEISGRPLARASLETMAASLGSDCPLFLHGSPVVMRGRGEILERLSDDEASRLTGRSLVLFKPFFGVSTEWAYRRLAGTGTYSSSAAAEREIADWRAGKRSLTSILRNDFEPVVGEKYPAIPVLLDALRREPGVSALMSGSGSACLALPGDRRAAEAVRARVREAYGERAFIVETEFC